MVTKEDVEKARAAWAAADASYDEAAYDAAWSNYQKLKEEYENGN